MPVRALVEAGSLLGIEQNNIRVSLARLHASGRVERDERGRYRLGPAVTAIRAQLRGWRHIEDRTRAWRGDWVAVHQSRLGRGPARRRRERALALLGFRELAPGLSIRPDNLRGGAAELRAALRDLVRVEDAAGDSGDPDPARVFVLRELDRESEDEARGLWDPEALVEEARASTSALRASRERLAQLSSEEAMAETFLLGGRVLRQLVRHPLLPPEILPPAPLDDLVAEMKRYDRIGRGHWAAFLARHDVPHRSLPLDSRFESLRSPAAFDASERARTGADPPLTDLSPSSPSSSPSPSPTTSTRSA